MHIIDYDKIQSWEDLKLIFIASHTQADGYIEPLYVVDGHPMTEQLRHLFKDETK